MTEKEIRDRAEQIIEALTALSLGREPNMLSNDAFKKLSGHDNFIMIRDTYIAYLQLFEGNIESPADIKNLFEFRMKIVELFDSY